MTKPCLTCPLCGNPKTFYSTQCGTCRRAGDYNPRLRRPIKRRFQEKVVIDHSTGCWLWTGAQDGHGYGQINIDGTPKKAYRLAYRLYEGEIPTGLALDHLCRVRLCVNPEHLEPVTAAENTRRQIAAIGHPRANKTHCPHGHPYNETNTSFAVRGKVRVCRICRAASSKAYRQRKKHDD